MLLPLTSCFAIRNPRTLRRVAAARGRRWRDNQIAAQPSKPRQRVIFNIRDQNRRDFPGSRHDGHQASSSLAQNPPEPWFTYRERLSRRKRPPNMLAEALSIELPRRHAFRDDCYLRVAVADGVGREGPRHRCASMPIV